MATYRLGSKGDEVRQIQDKLKALGIYKGPIDGDFGGGTETAVRNYQQTEQLEVDGKVGPLTWAALFREGIKTPQINYRPLDYRCLALTGSFETGAPIPDCFAGLSGDFDGQGLSFGVLQWNFGQGSLQPLLKRMCADHGEMARSIFHERFDQFLTMLNAPRSEQMTFARSIQDPNRKTVFEPWRGMFKTLGRTEEFQRIEADAANALYKAALQLCVDYGLWSARGVALMFDIKTQNGSIGSAAQAQIRADFQALPDSQTDEEREVARLRIIANRRAEAAKPRWVEDVRARKLCIANGGGNVHGIHCDLDEQFGIGLREPV
jgi:hypothetical protein